ncbi:ATP-grasp domain-containing protein [Aspergillus puulaauensis]|uniref:Prokaryotic glutathione synthetase ATP-binding domain-containing protein n=1 Tax=Aspergillus puulaauensis TaxID=1220207 RepID=A0A7R8AJH0_9EURO|nr:uncharacterized protein APUU_20062S [Aspergillus puulaauensis]BCS19630.1 hypothetical protein APUU_20062S [Aspergillus puulaauensis]
MKRILFLTSVPPHITEQYVSDNDWSNEMLPARLSDRGASITIKQWTDEDIIATLLESDLATFLWAEDYVRYPDAFERFLQTAKKAIEANGEGKNCPQVINHIDLVEWNMDKRYLLDMQAAGFDIPKTEIFDIERPCSVSMLLQQLEAFQSSGPLVLKPSVSASSNNTHFIPDISKLSDNDARYLESVAKGELQSSLVVQPFEPAITTGEYSFVFVSQRLSHAVLKVPKSGEFRCQEQFGSRVTRIPIESLGESTLSTVNAIFDTLWERFGNGTTGGMGYLRIDGLVTEDRPFILMEIEAIEPHLYLEMDGLEDLLSLLLK